MTCGTRITSALTLDPFSFFFRTHDKEFTPLETSGTTNVAKNLDPIMVSKEVIDVAKYLGNLQFRVWTKMQTTIKYSKSFFFFLNQSHMIC